MFSEFNVQSFETKFGATCKTGKVTIEWVEILLRIQKDLGSNSVRGPAILTQVFRGFSRPLQGSTPYIFEYFFFF
jgi:hypothetical protein